MLTHFLKDETGATVIEYGLIVAVLSLAVAGGVNTFGNAMVDMFHNVGTTMDEAGK